MIAEAQSGSSRPPVIFASLPVTEMFTGARRFESEAYLTGGFAIRRAIENSDVPFAPLAQLADVWQPGRLKGIKITAEHGIPFFTATQVFDLRLTARKWLAAGHTRDLEHRYVQPGWILVTCSGNVGQSIISYSAHTDAIISHDILRVQVAVSDLLGYVYAFLRTRYGQAMLRSSQYGSIIKHLEPEHLAPLPVPMADEAIQRSALRKIQAVFAWREEAYKLVLDAEMKYATAIGVRPYEPPDEAGYSVSASELFERRRLDGAFYNPAAESAYHALIASKKPLERLDSLVGSIFGVPRFKHIYTRHGIPYLDSEDVFKINPEITKFIPPPEEQNGSKARWRVEKYYVKKGWLLMACSGQVYGINGSAVLANAWHEQKVVSNHIVRIVPSEKKDAIPVGYLQIALGHSILGRPLILRTAFGTEVPEIAPADIMGFPVARAGHTIEHEIAEMVVQASDLRMKATAAEEEVVAEVERSIDDMLGGAIATEMSDIEYSNEPTLKAQKRA